MISWLKHKFGWNVGIISTWLAPNGRVMVGFLCECGELHSISEIPEHVFPEYTR